MYLQYILYLLQDHAELEGGRARTSATRAARSRRVCDVTVPATRRHHRVVAVTCAAAAGAAREPAQDGGHVGRAANETAAWAGFARTAVAAYAARRTYGEPRATGTTLAA